MRWEICEFDIIFGKGVSQASCIIDLGVEYEIIQKTGAWFAYNGEKIAQGREKAIDYIENNPEIANEIKDKILEIFKNGKN